MLDTGICCIVAVLSVVVCVNGDLRLQGGANEREGRLEVCNNQAWGTVCDNFWDNIDAGVACFQLGYTKAGKGGPINAQAITNLCQHLHYRCCCI